MRALIILILLFGQNYLHAIDIKNTKIDLSEEQKIFLLESIEILFTKMSSDELPMIEILTGIYSDLLESGNMRWNTYCNITTSLAFPQVMGLLFGNLNLALKSKDFNLLLEGDFVKSLTWFKFSKCDLYLFKILLVKNIENMLKNYGYKYKYKNIHPIESNYSHFDNFLIEAQMMRSENQFLKYGIEKYVEAWNSIILFVFEHVSSLVERVIKIDKNVVLFGEHGINIGIVEVDYSDIILNDHIDEASNKLVLRAQTGVSGTLKSYKLKFSSPQEMREFVETLRLISDLYKHTQKEEQNSLSNLLLRMRIACLNLDEQGNIVISASDQAKNKRSFKTPKGHKRHPNAMKKDGLTRTDLALNLELVSSQRDNEATILNDQKPKTPNRNKHSS